MSNRKSLSKKIRFEVFKRDKFTCQYCGNTAPNVVLEVDHIDPVAKGGVNDLLNLITSCFDCNRGKTDRKLDDDSVVNKQRSQLEMLQERREQIALMFDWRKELDKLDDDTAGMVVDYIENKIDKFTLNDPGKNKINKLTAKYELADILESVDISARKYIRYDDEGILTHESAEEFINKIGGILVNKNRPPIEQKASYIKGICRNRFSYWNPQTGSILLNDYIKALRDYGWPDEKILDDLENELMPKTKECRNWSEWRSLIEKWIDDVKGWKVSDDENSYDLTDDDFIETANELLTDRRNIIPALEYLGEPFEDFTSENLIEKLDIVIINYLTELEEYYLESPEQRGSKPYHTKAARSLFSLYSPVNNMLTYWLDNAVRGVIKQLLEPIEFYQEENPQHEHFRSLAEKYVELSQNEIEKA